MAAIIRQLVRACGVDQTCRRAAAALYSGLQFAPRPRRIGLFWKQLDQHTGKLGHGSAKLVAVQPQPRSADPRPPTALRNGAYGGGGTPDVRAGAHFGRSTEERWPIHQDPPAQGGAML